MSKLSDAFIPEQGASSRSPLPSLASYQKSRAGLLFESFASIVGDLEHRLPAIREGMQALVDAFMREVPRGRLALCPLLRQDPDTPFAPPRSLRSTGTPGAEPRIRRRRRAEPSSSDLDAM